MALPDFPEVNTGAIIELADMLQLIATGAADVGMESQNIRDAVVTNEVWNGTAAHQWYEVVTERIGDAGVTNDVMGTASATLAKLATDLDHERATYHRLRQEIDGEMALMHQHGGDLPAEQIDPTGVTALGNSVARAQGLLDKAATDLLALAILAGDIRAQPAANRTPGVPDGTDRNRASLRLLATLFGSVTDNRLSGAEFEQKVLDELGISKNTKIWRPNPAFEGRLTKGGLAKGTIPEGDGSNFLLEVKDTGKQAGRFQQRIQIEYANQTRRPLWMIKRAGESVPDSLVRRVEDTRGGVIYRTGPNTYVDGQGNPVQISYDKDTDMLTVKGYVRSTEPGGGSGPAPVAPPDPDAPSEPIDPKIADGGTDVSSGEPVAPGEPVEQPEPVEPVEPVEPIEPIEPIIP